MKANASLAKAKALAHSAPSRYPANMQIGVESEDEQAALYRLIEEEPHSVAGHVRLGDLRVRQGQDSQAIHFYRRALQLADCQDLAGEALSEVRRAEAALAELESRAHARREAVLTERGFPPNAWSPRLREALEIAGGRRKPYAPQPTDLY